MEVTSHFESVVSQSQEWLSELCRWISMGNNRISEMCLPEHRELCLLYTMAAVSIRYVPYFSRCAQKTHNTLRSHIPITHSNAAMTTLYPHWDRITVRYIIPSQIITSNNPTDSMLIIECIAAAYFIQSCWLCKLLDGNDLLDTDVDMMIRQLTLLKI